MFWRDGWLRSVLLQRSADFADRQGTTQTADEVESLKRKRNGERGVGGVVKLTLPPLDNRISGGGLARSTQPPMPSVGDKQWRPAASWWIAMVEYDSYSAAACNFVAVATSVAAVHVSGAAQSGREGFRRPLVAIAYLVA